MAITKEQALNYYRKMRQIREFEETIHRQNTTGEIPGFLHLYCGEEANAVGVCAHLSDEDYIASNHRGHGHCLAKGSDPRLMMMELYGREEGLCRGRGGSMHIAELDKGSLGANGIVGAGGPLAAGAALTQKLKGSKNIAVCFHGDGATNEGYMFEAMNMAVMWKLPIIFYCENNGYGEFTGIEYALGADSIAERAAAFGMPAKKINGNDFFEVYREVGEAVEHCRAGQGPYYIEAEAIRYYGHYEGDSQLYRTKEELKNLEDNDCLLGFRKKVTSDGLLTDAELDAVDTDVIEAFKVYLDEARSAAWPATETLCDHVYINY
ncbi:thiamine pyrophosphate-dependent dehydrogenase E1 component subunit alpha [Pseudoteredinibacter isoporae]|uniref:Pyruvate dehydrogenase E1 component alpha subunit n=1 Tax=Pseudoteredinibacter isoporae TaxID=570281 RepID=A0A7X0JRL6_9GAMM|nr:thiamine pyrophosphate-dependent dehydrogenase E1 component subunit alpha [Pseudoteredinibacter isoporae]MBB6521019.1 pyruvate dehydrogenase E1 component alpha subunit [Pseudoteredinibacter isoporae]NHO86584.1 thiamine pyrophosphate-dependent dehydrogenase E1 component subunit alpha [Pseudoteredinibacter isoporae]NIB24964.1 thiamine pyrophosphate-dependent dehydrogenase E1 component subunit alpha [Pseudoteredinibacter isoporae]